MYPAVLIRSHACSCLLLRRRLTVDDGDEQVGLDDGAEVEAAGGGLGGVGEDDVEAFELAGGEGLQGIHDSAAGQHCERETKSTHRSVRRMPRCCPRAPTS